MDQIKLFLTRSSRSLNLLSYSIILVLAIVGFTAVWASASPAEDTNIARAWELYNLGDYPAAEKILVPLALNRDDLTQQLDASFALGVLYSGEQLYPYQNFAKRITPQGESWWDYYEGRLASDVEESAKWFRFGNELCPTCEIFPKALAELYMAAPAYGGRSDPDEAAFWAREAVKLGSPLGAQIVAQLILSGEVKARKDEQAQALLEIAMEAESLDPVFKFYGRPAAEILKVMYITGTGVPRDLEKALALETSTSFEGPINFALASLEGIGRDKNPREAIDLLRPLAEKNLRSNFPSSGAILYFVLAKAYEKLDEPSSERNRIYWLKKAASGRVVEAYEQLGRAFYSGNGVSKDEDKARLYISLAAVNGVKSELLDKEITPMGYRSLIEMGQEGRLPERMKYGPCACLGSRENDQCNPVFPRYTVVTEVRTSCEAPSEYFKRLQKFK